VAAPGSAAGTPEARRLQLGDTGAACGHRCQPLGGQCADVPLRQWLSSARGHLPGGATLPEVSAMGSLRPLQPVGHAVTGAPTGVSDQP
ncbi:hypothetical protein DF186_15540, partial [Enterococcus hirae]